MINSPRKGNFYQLLKTATYKIFICFIVLVYVFSPLNSHLVQFFHNFSHELQEFVSTTMHHHPHNTHAHKESHSHTFLGSTDLSKQLKDIELNQHDHKLLHFFSIIFSSNDNNESDKSVLATVSLDKHLSFNPLNSMPEIAIINDPKNSWSYLMFLETIYISIPKPPPII